MVKSKAADLGEELSALTKQIDRIELNARIGLEVINAGVAPFHPRAYARCREHCLAILKAARAELLVEVAKEVGLPARFEEATQEAVVVQQPSLPDLPVLPEEPTPNRIPGGSDG